MAIIYCKKGHFCQWVAGTIERLKGEFGIIIPPLIYGKDCRITGKSKRTKKTLRITIREKDKTVEVVDTSTGDRGLAKASGGDTFNVYVGVTIAFRKSQREDIILPKGYMSVDDIPDSEFFDPYINRNFFKGLGIRKLYVELDPGQTYRGYLKMHDDMTTMCKLPNNTKGKLIILSGPIGARVNDLGLGYALTNNAYFHRDWSVKPTLKGGDVLYVPLRDIPFLPFILPIQGDGGKGYLYDGYTIVMIEDSDDERLTRLKTFLPTEEARRLMVKDAEVLRAVIPFCDYRIPCNEIGLCKAVEMLEAIVNEEKSR